MDFAVPTKQMFLGAARLSTKYSFPTKDEHKLIWNSVQKCLASTLPPELQLDNHRARWHIDRNLVEANGHSTDKNRLVPPPNVD